MPLPKIDNFWKKLVAASLGVVAIFGAGAAIVDVARTPSHYWVTNEVRAETRGLVDTTRDLSVRVSRLEQSSVSRSGLDSLMREIRKDRMEDRIMLERMDERTEQILRRMKP